MEPLRFAGVIGHVNEAAVLLTSRLGRHFFVLCNCNYMIFFYFMRIKYLLQQHCLISFGYNGR